jgi:pyrroline-5-carboxylate reductase
MGEALVAGLLNGGWARPDEMVVVEPVAERRDQLAARFPGLGLSGTAVGADGAVLAVKPGDAEAACRDIAAAGAARVLSIAAGVTTARIQEWLDSEVPVVRAMPNTPALVGAGAAAIAPGATAGDADLDWAQGILAAVGVVQRVSESALDAVTGLSGSGPAYIFLMTEALIEAGVLNGLSRSTATVLVIQTLIGSARLLAESGDTPETLRAAVTSPGGTTAAGLRILENHAVRSAFLEAVTAATERSRELGQGG